MSSCCEKKKERSEDEKKDLIIRLNRIEGQIRGLKKMVEEDAYCLDIINQTSAASAALNGFSKELLNRHLHSCVISDIKNGNEQESIDELLNILGKLMK